MKRFLAWGIAAGSAASAGHYVIERLDQNVFKSAKYVENYDGDTVTVDLPGLPDIFGHHIPVRVAHIDAPEMGSAYACERRAASEATVAVNHLLVGTKRIELVEPRRDKYFRILADIRVGRILLSEYLLSRGLAYPYEGGEKQVINWCTKINR